MNLRLLFHKALHQLGLIEQAVLVRGSVRRTRTGGSAVVRSHTAMRATKPARRQARRISRDSIQSTPEEREIQEKSPLVQTIRAVAADRQWTHPVAWEQAEWRTHLQAVLDALNLSEPELVARLSWLGLHQVERASDGLPVYTDSGIIKPIGGEDELKRSLWRAAQPSLAKGIHGGGHPIDYRTEFQGLPISIENRKGSIRHWKNEQTGEEGETKFEYPYGYLRRTQGIDGDHVDCFLGPNPDATHAYIIHQMKRPDFTVYDEDKVMLGFDSATEAKAAYLRHYTDPRFFGSMHAIPMEEFTRKVLATKDHPHMLKALSKSDQEDYELETEAIRERAKTAEAQQPHRFRAARWTHPNGHPRCRICGEEEREGAMCAGRAVFQKSRLALRFGKSACSPGEKCRWITVHSHGSGEGQPVLIRESKTQPGTYHVIGGAGGKLNYLKLTDVKSPEHYKDQARSKAKDRRDAAKEQAQRDKEAGTYEPKKLALDALRTAKHKKERELIEQVATLMGWQDYDLSPEKLIRYSEGAQRLAALRHHRQLLQQAQAVVKQTRERLLVDADARAEAQLGELSIRRHEPDVLGLTDLDPSNSGQGLGFAPHYGQKVANAGLTAEALEQEAKELQAAYQASQSPEAKESGKRLQASMAAIRGEVERAQTEGALATPDRPIRPAPAAQAVKLLALAKEVQGVQRQTREKGEKIKAGDLEPIYKSYVVQAEPVSSAEILEELERDADERARQDLTRSFLREVEMPDEGQTEAGRAAALHQHIQLGASTALTKACQTLTGQDVLPRDVVDVLGAAGAAQALAWALHKHLRPADVEQAAEALATYHQQHHQEAADEALAQARELTDQAKELELGTVEHPTDLAMAHELNEQRLEALRQARSILGTTLGELEGMASLELALSHAPVTQIQVSLGPISREQAIQQLRALGMAKEDYTIDTDGSNQFATVHESGLPKLTQRIDPELAERIKVTQAILAGEQDEEGWLPAGFTSRPQSSYTDPSEQAVTFQQSFMMTPGGTLEQDLHDYIGSRMADGEPVGVIYRSLLSQEVLDSIPEDRRSAYFEAVDHVAPLRDADGKVQRAEMHIEAFQRMAEEFVRKKYGGEAAPLHLQRIDPESPKSFEALHRTLAEDPQRMVAFKRMGDLTHEDQRVLRDYFERTFAKPEADAKTTAALEELGPAPAKDSEGLFGVQENPAWSAWQAKRNEILSQATQNGLTWDKYVNLHHGREGAYAAMQDALKSDMVRAYSEQYKKIAKVPLKLGRTVLRGNLAHMEAVDPSAREARLAEQQALTDRLRNRIDGKYAVGSVKDKLDRARELAAIADQNQLSMFQAKPTGQTEGQLGTDERWTLGETVEHQLAAILPQVSRNFSPFRPVSLMPDLRMDGKYIRQQRAIKLFEANKRMVMALGTGSGKAQSLDAKILTPIGWKCMGEIQVGDQVIAVDGSPTIVTGVYPQGEKAIYRVIMSDGASTQCCEEHLWLTQTWVERKNFARSSKTRPIHAPKVRSLSEIMSSLFHDGGQANHAIPMIKRPIVFMAQETPIAPYLLGVLLGDGNMSGSNSVRITMADQDILNELYPIIPSGLKIFKESSRPYDYRITTGRRGHPLPINRLVNSLKDLGLMGKKSGGKFVPDIYKFNTPEVRLAVLQGLMDTDGEVDKSGYSCYFSSTSWQLTKDMMFLIRSLGGVASLSTKQSYYCHNGEKRAGQLSYKLTVSMPPDIMPFRLKRKACKVIAKSKYAPIRYIVAINYEGMKPAQCIAISHPSHLYVTDDFIVTHNTGISLGAFTHLHSQGKVKHGIYAVPSVVQEQFGPEAANMLKPGTYQWWAKPGADRAERLAAYRDPTNHFVVVTHQALRDDLVHLMAGERGIAEEEMAQQFQEMSEAERQATLRQTLGKAGIDWQLLNIDEGHDALNRRGKPNSLFANVLDALGQTTPYFISASADPIKNDVSELYDQLHKVDPQRFHDRDAFLSKYGINTNVSQDALKRLIMPYILPGRVDPGVKANQRDVPVVMSDRQKRDYEAIMAAYRKAKQARADGQVDLPAIHTLSPSSFEGKPKDQYEAIAKHLTDNAGILRDMALDRVLNTSDPAQNAKIQEAVKIAGQYRDQGKPGLIFAHHRDAVAHLTKALRDEGHRVVTITGSDSAKQKAAKIQQFRPAGGREPQADVMVVSDAGAVGMNAQRGQWVLHYDLPDTAKTWWQRTGRIHRLGQTSDVDVLTMQTDTRHDQKKRDRLNRKNGLREVLTSPYESMEESGLGAVLAAMQANQAHHPDGPGPVGGMAA